MTGAVQGLAIDETMRGALARLTANEKECLRRRLLHQTAKEMALDLGISPHAVEKRLKMARTKLGLSSSVEAARLLADFEQYQQAGPQPTDLANDEPQQQKRFSKPLVVGGITMSIFAAGLIALAVQTPSTADVGSASEMGAPAEKDMKIGDVRKLEAADMVKVTPKEARAFAEDVFNGMDKNKSGFIERDEAPVTLEISDTKWAGDGPPPREWFEQQKFRPAPIEPVMAQGAFIAKYDKNADGKLSFEEFWQGARQRITLDGVPKRWKDEYLARR